MDPAAGATDQRAGIVKGLPAGRSASRWGAWLGMGAFLFFLIKGLAWLVVPAAIAYFAST